MLVRGGATRYPDRRRMAERGALIRRCAIARPGARRLDRRVGAGAGIWLGLALLVSAPARAQRDAGWEVRVAERVEVAAGASAPLTIALAVDRGLAVSKDAAVIIDLAPGGGLTVKKRRLGRPDAVDPEADAPRFAASVRGDAPGEHVVQVRVRFWLCRSRTCRPIDARRTATVVVADPPPAETGSGTPSKPPR
jgi:hypothetical protein